MTDKIMFKHAFLKWDWIVKNWTKHIHILKYDSDKYIKILKKELPFLKKYIANCSFCNKYYMNSNDCEGCPLLKYDKACWLSGSLFDRVREKYDFKSAVKLRNICKKLLEEYEQDNKLSKIKPKRPLIRIMVEGIYETCDICGSSVKRKYNILGLFYFGRKLGCYNPNCKNTFYVKGEKLI
jgi:hypothetical protein